MRKLFLTLALLFVLAPVVVHAAQGARYAGTSTITLLNNVAMNGLVATRTFSFPVGELSGLGLVVLQFKYTRSAGSAVTLVCTGSLDGQTTKAALQVCDSTTTGVCTLVDQSWTKAVSTSKNFIIQVAAQGSTEIECIAAVTGAAAGDLLTVKGRLQAF